MTDFINILAMLSWMLGGIALTATTYLLARRFMPPRDGADGHHYPASVREMSATTGLRISALFGVLLALVYAQELQNYRDVRAGLTREAVAIAQMHFDAGEYGGPGKPVIQLALATYVHDVVETEWPRLGIDRKLSQITWDSFNRAKRAIEGLEPANARETAIRERMLEDLKITTDLRNMRQHQAADSVPWFFAAPALGGILLVTLPLFIYPPARETWVMLGAYGAFVGMIMFFIQAFANPFDQPFQMPPTAFRQLMETHVGNPTAPSDGDEG